MFPLGTVLLPGNPLPLQVFEPRYLAMLRDIAGGDGRFGVVLIERGFEVGGGDERFSIGTVAVVERVSPAADRIRLVARGAERFEVVRWLDDDPYPRAEVSPVSDLVWEDEQSSQLDETERVVRRALAVMSEYRTQVWPADVELSEDPVMKAWQLAGVAPLGTLDRLALLRSSSVGELLERAAALTTDAVDLLPLQFPDDPG